MTGLEVEAWIDINRVREAKRRGWTVVGRQIDDAVLMRGNPDDLGENSIPGCSPLFPEGAADFAGWPADLPAQCESAIERRMIRGLLALHAGRQSQVRFAPAHTVLAEFEHMLDARKYPGMWLHVFPQAEVKRYRLDFLIVATGFNSFAAPHPINKYCLIDLECDGAAFHLDVWKDLDREHDIARRNIHTLRFSGSQIWHDERRCAEMVCWFAVQQIWPGKVERYTHCTHWQDGWKDLILQASHDWDASFDEERDFPEQGKREGGHA